MESSVKPNIKGLKKEGKIQFNGTSYHNGSNADTLESLLDNDINNHTIYGVIVSTNINSHFKFTIFQKSNIWAYGKSYSDGGGSTPLTISLYKINSNNTLTLVKNNIKTKSNEWYLLFDNLDIGMYQVKSTVNYNMFTEWYVENLTSKLLIKQDDKYYSLKDENFKDNKFVPLEFDKQNLNDDIKQYMFDDVNIILQNKKINEVNTPIINLFNNPIKLLIYKDIE